MKKENKIAKMQYSWLKGFLKPLLSKPTYSNFRKYKRFVAHNKNKKFNELDENIKKIYLDFAKDLLK